MKKIIALSVFSILFSCASASKTTYCPQSLTCSDSDYLSCQASGINADQMENYHKDPFDFSYDVSPTGKAKQLTRVESRGMIRGEPLIWCVYQGTHEQAQGGIDVQVGIQIRLNNTKGRPILGDKSNWYYVDAAKNSASCLAGFQSGKPSGSAVCPITIDD